MHADIEVFERCEICLKKGLYHSEDLCSNVTFLAKPHVNYSILVTAAEGEEDGFFHVSFYRDEPRPNQVCLNASDVRSLPYHTSGYIGTSKEVVSDCRVGDGTDAKAGLWYHIKGTGNKITAATVSGSTDFYSVLEVHTGCPNDIYSGTCETYSEVSHEIKWDSVNGYDYYVFVRGWNGGLGFFSLIVYENIEPANSKCVNAESLSLHDFAMGYTSNASLSDASCVNVPRRGLWYKVRVDAPESVILSTCSRATAFNTDIEVYQSCSETGATGCIDHVHDYRCDRGTIITFSAEANKDYFVFVTGNRADIDESGFFRLSARTWHHHQTSSSGLWNSISEEELKGLGPAGILFIIVACIAVVAGGAIGGFFFLRRRSAAAASYTRMDVPDGLDAN